MRYATKMLETRTFPAYFLLELRCGQHGTYIFIQLNQFQLQFLFLIFLNTTAKLCLQLSFHKQKPTSCCLSNFKDHLQLLLQQRCIAVESSESKVGQMQLLLLLHLIAKSVFFISFASNSIIKCHTHTHTNKLFMHASLATHTLSFGNTIVFMV